jgi:hypothetical protein
VRPARPRRSAGLTVDGVWGPTVPLRRSR